MSIQLGPNPATDNVNLYVPISSNSVYTIQLIDANAQLISSYVPYEAGTNIIKLNTKGKTKGLYMSVSFDNASIIKTLRIQIK